MFGDDNRFSLRFDIPLLFVIIIPYNYTYGGGFRMKMKEKSGKLLGLGAAALLLAALVLFINQPKSSISLLVSVKSEKAMLSLKSDMSYTSHR